MHCYVIHINRYSRLSLTSERCNFFCKNKIELLNLTDVILLLEGFNQ